MSEIDAKVNMSLDEIIKMEKKKKKKKTGPANGKTGPKQNRGNARGGRSGLRGRGARVKHNVNTAKKEQTWQRVQHNNVRGGFVKKRYNKNSTLVKTRSSLSLNQTANVRGGFNVRRGRGNRFGITRTRNRTNLTFAQGGFFTNNKVTLKRTNSLPNLRDPTSVHNRLGYQSPAQIAYRNRVKRAKQLLLQQQNQRLILQNQFRMPQAVKTILAVQQRPLERRQQILTSQRRFTTGGLRSDQIARAQRRAQHEQKLLRINSARVNTNSNMNFMRSLSGEYSPSTRQRSLSPSRSRNGGSMTNLHQLPRKQSSLTQSVYKLNQNSPTIVQQIRLSVPNRSRSPNVLPAEIEADIDNRIFSELMFRGPGMGVTEKTLNDRFSS